MSDIINPKVFAATYLAYGAAQVFVKRPSKLLAASGAVVGAMMFANAWGQWRDASRGLASRGPFEGRLGRSTRREDDYGEYDDGAEEGDESLEDAFRRTDGVTEQKRMRSIDGGIEGRIKEIREYIHKGTIDPKIREKAMAVLTRKTGAPGERRWKIPEKNWEAEVKAIFDAVRDPNSPIAVRYVLDPRGTDTYVSARKTGELRGGDCDDQGSIYIGSLFRSVGYPVKMRVVRGTNEKNFGHIYTLVGLPPSNPTRWIAADPTENHPFGWEPPDRIVAERRDFDV